MTEPEAADDVDWWAWLERWDRQQEVHVPGRDDEVTFMFEVVDQLGAAPGALLELGCGPGSVARRALDRFTSAHVTAVDLDPFLLEVARRTTGDRVTWMTADLRSPGWSSDLADASFDAVITTTALHWLAVEEVERLAADVARLLRTGGVFANFDTILLDRSTPRLADAATALRSRMVDQRRADAAEDWDGWWEAAAREPAFDDLLAERRRRFTDRRFGVTTTVGEQGGAFVAAGFAEVGTLAQRGDKRLLVAIR